MDEKIAVIGLGYVGLPVALALARRFPGTIGFDINERRIEALGKGIDTTGEIEAGPLIGSTIRFTSAGKDLEGATFFVIAVPTPVDASRQPDLTALVKASETVGRALRPGAVVVYESTVYPGVTEDVCGDVLERMSGLRRGVDFKLGYSPERINPGDKEHTLERIVKVVSGEDGEALDRIAAVYGAIIPAGIHRAPSIRVAEAAKVIENTQRDLNIALMNELAIIFDKMGIRTQDVLDASATKWNFLRFTPGLVGGHCIGVDPYYLTAKAEQLGHHPEVILAGRRINDGMGAFIARKLVKLLIEADRPVRGARVGILGLTFKENVPDLRNSKVIDIVRELREFGVEPMVHDPFADAQEAREEFGVELSSLDNLRRLDGLVLAVAHRDYVTMTIPELADRFGSSGRGVIVDVKSVLEATTMPPGILYWSL
ncbi:nucleotide sugar dehydrogenase [Arenibaculum sp.]|jgi:UDP-N-acetyl-D-galactosamine dehydrogenase|uniref:nucleotide sugar dehydrogenase n=1 Tax=Arenibaculum sp. TaxID=2865862 RepID=UPI002E117E61|nr:nucleotide sugar dehydrogenase [Arenibaculum sp.]